MVMSDDHHDLYEHDGGGGANLVLADSQVAYLILLCFFVEAQKLSTTLMNRNNISGVFELLLLK
jgi:hypothetical protein